MSKLEKLQRRLLTAEEVRFFGQRFRQLMGELLVGMLNRYGVSPEDHFRFHPLAVRLASARAERGLDLKAAAAALKVARYRLAEIERGGTKNVDAELLIRYVDYLGLKNWFGRWKRANASLAKRLRITGAGKLTAASRAARRERRAPEAGR
ncbi:MAG: helix-turn-helix domain-containing protein [Nitrospirota bacterium]